MKISLLLAASFPLVFLFGCSGEPKENNNDSLSKISDSAAAPAKESLIGKVFREPSELPELAGYEDVGGSVLTEPGKPDFEFGISWLRSPDKNIVVLEKFISQPDGKTRYEILDTVSVPKLKEDQYISYCDCYSGDVFDSRIIALVKTDSAAFYKTIYKAWIADTRLKKIVPIEDPNGIRCTNNGFGEGEGEE